MGNLLSSTPGESASPDKTASPNTPCQAVQEFEPPDGQVAKISWPIISVKAETLAAIKSGMKHYHVLPDEVPCPCEGGWIEFLDADTKENHSVQLREVISWDKTKATEILMRYGGNNLFWKEMSVTQMITELSTKEGTKIHILKF
jgi:hypothetical protein